MKIPIKITNGSIQIAKVNDIPILIHWTFSLLVIFIISEAVSNQMKLADTLWYFLLFILIFLFVILHELGHAFAAARYQINTRDIIISPIGGVARLEGIPTKPFQEIIVALAGPLVNVGLALLLFIILTAVGQGYIPLPSSTLNLTEAPTDFMKFLFFINLMLVIFNLIPAFPMDGGRIFRALLSMKFNRKRATYIAMILARILAFVFFVIGYYAWHPMLMLIGGFVLLTSGLEYKQVKKEHSLKNLRAINAKIINPTILTLENKIEEITSLKRNDQIHYPVGSSSGAIIGVLTRPAISMASKDNSSTREITSYITDSHGYISASVSLKSVFSLMDKNEWYTATLFDNDLKEVGIIDRKSVQNCLKNGQTDEES